MMDLCLICALWSGNQNWLQVLEMSKYDLILTKPWMNAAGSLGFRIGSNSLIDPSDLGAFVTNPVSLKSRQPAHQVHFMEFPSGFLMHTGHPNPGLHWLLRKVTPTWEHMPCPIIVHLLCQTPAEVTYMVERLEGIAGIIGFELGLPPHVDANLAREFIRAAAHELPVIVRIALDQVISLADALALERESLDISAISLGPPRGCLPVGENTLVQGRIYGPALYPQSLACVQNLVRSGWKVIGAGGVYSVEQAQVMLNAGAMAVQFDTVLWRNNPFSS
jgi:dihydroorotate dehydrogenase (NAD+) catalytic subunit